MGAAVGLTAAYQRGVLLPGFKMTLSGHSTLRMHMSASEEEAGLPMASNDNSRSGQIGDNLQLWLAAYRQHALSVLQRGQILCRI